MTWALSASVCLLLRTVAPLIRRGPPRLAMAAMATLVCVTAPPHAGHGLSSAVAAMAARGGAQLGHVVDGATQGSTARGHHQRARLAPQPRLLVQVVGAHRAVRQRPDAHLVHPR